jgi:DNA-binding SARP family transcriptional activator
VLVAEDAAAVDRMDLALRMLAALHAGQPATNPAPVPQVLLRHPDGSIDVFLADPIGIAPAPWTAAADGQIWTLPADAATTRSDLPPPCPALVQLGTTEDGAELYADLEALGILAIDADDPADLRGIARAVTATLTLSPLGELVRVRTVGFDPYGLTSEERLTAEESIDDLLEHVAADAAHTLRALTRAQLTGTFPLRARVGDDNWDPTVAVLAGSPPTGATAAKLTELTGAGGRGVAVVTAASPHLPARWHLTLDRGDTNPRPRWRLDPLGISVTPLRLAAEELADLAGLLADAAAPPEDLPPEPATPDEPDPAAAQRLEHRSQPSTASATTTLHTGPREEPATADDWAVMLRLLGPVDVIRRDGYRPDAVHGRTLELLAWLVTHRPHGTRAGLESAVWPTGAHPGTITNELGRARRLLEHLAGPDAQDWIPARPLDLNPAVVSDLDLVRAHLSRADHHPDQPETAIPELQAAVDLIRGVPAHYSWLDAELGSTLTTLPIRAATRLAELHLAQADTDAVLAVTTRGLLLIPAHTELFALRMRAAAAAGDRPAVKAEYEAYLRAEKADPFYDDETDPDLQRLHQQLLHQRSRAG